MFVDSDFTELISRSLTVEMRTGRCLGSRFGPNMFHISTKSLRTCRHISGFLY